MGKNKGMISIKIKQGQKTTMIRSPLSGISKFVFIFNNQFTNAPNTTQIASGAGRSSAAGNNAAIDSSNTSQQQSVGAGGKANNTDIIKGMNHKRPKRTKKNKNKRHSREIHIVINHQIVKRSKGAANFSATQVASGGGKYSTGGTNSAIESKGTKQQHAVGGGKGSIAKNKRINVKSKKRKRRYAG